MQKIIVWLKRTVARFWAPAVDVPQFVPEKAKVRRPRVKTDQTQAHYYLGDLLDQLEQSFDDLEYLRRGDPEGAANFEKFGWSVCSSDSLLSIEMEPFFYSQLPAQGCFYFGRHDTLTGNEKTDRMSFRFLYFQKQRQPVNVQATNGTTYTIGGVWGVKERHLFQMHVAVYPDQSIRVLKTIRPHRFKVGKSSRRNGGSFPRTVVRMEWGYPEAAMSMLAEYNKRSKKRLTLDEYIGQMFSFLVNSVLRSEGDMNVRVKKGGRVATFAINMLRTPYFFSDREKTLNQNGNTERILHIVRPHARNGKMIKAHWRGLRRFTWNGYDVSIGMPGAHYTPLVDFTAEAWVPEDMERAGLDGMDPRDAAALIDKSVTAQTRN